MADQDQNQQQKKQEKRPSIKMNLECSEPQKTAIGFLIRVGIIVTQGDRSLENRRVRLFFSFSETEEPKTSEKDTDSTGRAYFQILAPADAKMATFEAQLVNSSSRSSRQTVAMPETRKTEESMPAFLIVDPRRIDNEISFFIRILDEKNRGVENVGITIIENGELIPQRADKTGEIVYPLSLSPSEEKEISINVTGLGIRGYRHTFRGRSK